MKNEDGKGRIPLNYNPKKTSEKPAVKYPTVQKTSLESSLERPLKPSTSTSSSSTAVPMEESPRLFKEKLWDNIDFLKIASRKLEDADMSDFLFESSEAPELAEFVAEVCGTLSQALKAIHDELLDIRKELSKK